jgi:16S rRNA (uracil1498-N3)-methyltransferase
MPRFFVNPDAITDSEIIINGDDAHHIARSLRMAEGDCVTVCDGQGEEYSCRLSRIRDDECLLEIISHCKSSAESPLSITLFMAYPKGDKMETVVQKAVELGASRIVAFESSRCIKRPAKDKEEKLLTRLSRIAEEAAKQCGRGILPTVLGIYDTKRVVREGEAMDLLLLCYENESAVTLRRVLDGCKDKSISSVGIIIGSEGGFSKEEAELFVKGGAVSVNLGPRILRCETAPEYALSAISYHFEL